MGEQEYANEDHDADLPPRKDRTANLRRKLQQAQGERDEAIAARNAQRQATDAAMHWQSIAVNAEAERDAAIKDAAEQRALAKARLDYGLWALDTIRVVLEKGATITVGPGQWKGYATARTLAPAEALRAESPQSGQEEGD